MGWNSINLKPGETLVDFVRRDCPSTDFAEVREVTPGFVAVVINGPATWAPWRTPDAAGFVRFAGVALIEGGYIKYMEEGHGPYTPKPFPADMLAMLSPLDKTERPGFAHAWQARQS